MANLTRIWKKFSFFKFVQELTRIDKNYKFPCVCVILARFPSIRHDVIPTWMRTGEFWYEFCTQHGCLSTFWTQCGSNAHELHKYASQYLKVTRFIYVYLAKSTHFYELSIKRKFRNNHVWCVCDMVAESMWKLHMLISVYTLTSVVLITNLV